MDGLRANQCPYPPCLLFRELGDPYAVLSVATEVECQRTAGWLEWAPLTNAPRPGMGANASSQRHGGDPPPPAGRAGRARGAALRQDCARSGARTAQTCAPTAPSVKHDGNASRNPFVTDRILYIVTCGAPLASRIADGITASRNRGWQPFVIPTDASRRWIDADALDAPVLSDHRAADHDERAPAPGCGCRRARNLQHAERLGERHRQHISARETMRSSRSQRSQPSPYPLPNMILPDIQHGWPQSPSSATPAYG